MPKRNPNPNPNRVNKRGASKRRPAALSHEQEQDNPVTATNTVYRRVDEEVENGFAAIAQRQQQQLQQREFMPGEWAAGGEEEIGFDELGQDHVYDVPELGQGQGDVGGHGTYPDPEDVGVTIGPYFMSGELQDENEVGQMEDQGQDGPQYCHNQAEGSSDPGQYFMSRGLQDDNGQGQFQDGVQYNSPHAQTVGHPGPYFMSGARQDNNAQGQFQAGPQYDWPQAEFGGHFDQGQFQPGLQCQSLNPKTAAGSRQYFMDGGLQDYHEQGLIQAVPQIHQSQAEMGNYLTPSHDNSGLQTTANTPSHDSDETISDSSDFVEQIQPESPNIADSNNHSNGTKDKVQDSTPQNENSDATLRFVLEPGHIFEPENFYDLSLSGSGTGHNYTMAAPVDLGVSEVDGNLARARYPVAQPVVREVRSVTSADDAGEGRRSLDSYTEEERNQARRQVRQRIFDQLLVRQRERDENSEREARERE